MCRVFKGIRVVSHNLPVCSMVSGEYMSSSSIFSFSLSCASRSSISSTTLSIFSSSCSSALSSFALSSSFFSFLPQRPQMFHAENAKQSHRDGTRADPRCSTLKTQSGISETEPARRSQVGHLRKYLQSRITETEPKSRSKVWHSKKYLQRYMIRHILTPLNL